MWDHVLETVNTCSSYDGKLVDIHKVRLLIKSLFSIQIQGDNQTLPTKRDIHKLYLQKKSFRTNQQKDTLNFSGTNH